MFDYIFINYTIKYMTHIVMFIKIFSKIFFFKLLTAHRDKCYYIQAKHKQMFVIEKVFTYIIPRGQSLENYTQDDIDLMMSHINSYGRKRLNDVSPYDVFTLIYGQETAELLGIRKIPNDEIILTPVLLKK